MKLFKRCNKTKLNPAIYVAILVPLFTNSSHSGNDLATGLLFGLLIGIGVLSIFFAKKNRCG